MAKRLTKGHAYTICISEYQEMQFRSIVEARKWAYKYLKDHPRSSKVFNIYGSEYTMLYVRKSDGKRQIACLISKKDKKSIFVYAYEDGSLGKEIPGKVTW